MSIFNLTPDSFSDGGKILSTQDSLNKASADLSQGADILDLGAYSTRPGADLIDIHEEWERLAPHLKAIRKEFPQSILSIDTFRSEIARMAIEEGADLINDITGGNGDLKMFSLIGEKNIPYILMHSRGNPQNMQTLTHYDDLVLNIIDELQEKVFQLRELNVKDLILDPGFGFAKTIDQNFKLLKNLKDFQVFNLPILIGISKKSMIHKSLNIPIEESINGTTAIHMLALEGGAHILRVHDIWAASEALKLWNLYRKA